MTRWPAQTARAALRNALALGRHEFRISLRERAGWGAIVVASVLAFIDSALKPHLPLVSGIRASTFGGTMVLAPLAIVLAAGAARRDEAVAASDITGVRPYPAHVLFLARLAGNYALVLFAYGLTICSSLAAPVVMAGRWPALLTPIHALVRGVVPLLYVVALTYCGVALARNALAAALVALYWLFLFLWRDLLARAFQFSLTQNWPTYAAISLAVVLATMSWQRWRGRAPAGWLGRRLWVAAIGLLLLGVLDAWHRVATSHDPPLRADPFVQKVASQYIRSSPRVPGFWLPDQRGRPFRLSSTDGKALVIGFWSPQVPESVAVLEALRAISSEFSGQDATCIAVCLADDHSLSPHLAAEGRFPFVMVTDTGTHFAPNLTACAPTAEAYYLARLPAVLVTDRGRRLVGQLDDAAIEQPRLAFPEVRKALAVAVPPP